MTGEALANGSIFLSTQPADQGDRRLALTAVLVSALVFAVAAPFAGEQLPHARLFLPMYQSALVMCDVITAVMLYGQFAMLHSGRLLVLGSAYLFSGSMAVLHLMSFPELFSAGGLLGSGPQTTAWLYFMWHMGFPAAVIACALMRDEEPASAPARSAAAPIAAAGAAVVAVAVGLMLLATAGQGALPAIMHGNRDLPAKRTVAWATWLLTAAALPVLWRRGRATVLDLWLMVVIVAWLCDVAQSAVFNAGRFSLGWYTGRIYGLLASGFLLSLLILEYGKLYAKLAAARLAERSAWRRAEQKSRQLAELNESLERLVHQRTAALETELKALGQAEEALREERDFMQTVLGNTNALIVVMDTEGRIVRFNEACEKTSGLRVAAVRGKRPWEVLAAPEEREDVKGVFEALRAGSFPSRYENHWQRPDGERRLIAWVNACVLDAAGAIRYVVASGIDVTEQRRAELELSLRQADVARLHRLQSMGEMTALVAHEVNQPLAAISNFAEASLGQIERGENRQRIESNLQKIAQQAQRAAQPLQQLGRFLARSAPEKVPAELNTVLQTACGLVERLAIARGVQLDCGTDASLPRVLAQPMQIEQVLVNLLQNALDAIGASGVDNGVVTVRVRHAAGDGSVRIDVEDNGPGLDAGLVQTVFDPLYTTKSNGLGLGLAICRSIVGAQGGRIWADPGPGGRFHFTVPVAP